MDEVSGTAPRQGSARPDVLRRVDPAIAAAFGCIVALLLVGSLYSSSFLSPEYLLQQLKVASFLGVIATGAMLVILLGQIDLSVPWVVAVGGMMSIPVEITKDSKEAVFTVVTTEKSNPGLTKNVSCSVVITKNNEPITHLIAPGSVLRIDPAKAKTTVAAAKE